MRRCSRSTSLRDSLARERLALETARSFFQQIVVTRRWNARHAAIYVPVTPRTQPNQYLDTPQRDLVINDTLTLTQVNPAFMTRQLADIAREENNIQFNITSLRPLRPENRPRPWEEDTLRLFENSDIREKGEFIGQGANQRFHYMAALVTEQPCLVCHAQHGYRFGDIRGGISVTLPPLNRSTDHPLIISHSLIALVGTVLLVIMGVRLNRSYEHLRRQAVLDALTSIPNRRYFIEQLMEEFRRGRREKMPLSLIICDIDNFKRYNDLLGHPAGDRCLKVVAQTIQDSMHRAGDFCARYGGEEFVVVLPNTTLAQALVMAESIREAVAGLSMRHPGADNGIVTLSLGVATDDQCHPDPELLIRQADEALYRAKSLGRNRVEGHNV